MKNKEYTIKEIAEKLKITEAEVKRIERSALKKILKSSIANDLKDYQNK